jgi:hypothetical protein
LLALIGVGRWESLYDEDDAIYEGGMKTSGQLRRDDFRLAAFDAGRCLEIAFGVKRKWKKRKDGG